MKRILVCIFFSIMLIVEAQNDIQLSHMAFVRQYFNPAATGQNLNTVFNTIYRVQWTGINDAPVTWVGNVQHYFNAARVAIGLSVIDDKLGLEHHQMLKSAYAYRIFWREGNYLSFGLSAGVLANKIDIARLALEDNSEMIHVPENSWKADFDVGMELRLRNMMIGFSITHIGNKFPNTNIFILPMHYYGYLRLTKSLIPNYEMSFAYSVNATRFNMLHEINTSFLLRQFLFVGFSYRVNESVVSMLGMQLFGKMKVGYSYDMSAGRLPTYCSHGSHEIFLQYQLQNEATGQPSPRFFD